MASYPSEYARSREQRRRGQVWVFALFLLAADAAMIFKVGYWVAVVPPAVALIGLGVALVSRARQRQTGNQAEPPTWPAQMPAWVLRAHGVTLRGRLRDTVELTGRLQLRQGALTWSPSKGAARIGGAQIAWPLAGLQNVSVTPISGITPMSLLHFGQQNGRQADIWLRASPGTVRDALGRIGVVAR